MDDQAKKMPTSFEEEAATSARRLSTHPSNQKFVGLNAAENEAFFSSIHLAVGALNRSPIEVQLFQISLKICQWQKNYDI